MNVGHVYKQYLKKLKKNRLFELINGELKEARERYQELLAGPEEIEKVLKLGAEKARDFSQPFIKELRHAVGIRPLS